MAIIKLSAVVLKTVPFGESSLIATLYSLNHGLLKCAVRSGRKHGKSSLPVERGTLAEVMLYHKEGRDVHNVADFLVLNSYDNIAKSILKVTVRDFAFELFLLMITDSFSHPELYFLLNRFLSSIDTGGEVDVYPFYLWLFMYRLIQFEGFSFIEQTCVSCGNSLSGDIALNNRLGGFECSSCYSSDNFKIIPHSLIEKLSGKKNTEIDDNLRKNAHVITQILVEYIKFNSGNSFKLKSAEILYSFV